MEQPNMDALCQWLTKRQGRTPGEMKRMLRTFNGFLEPFKQASDHYERIDEKRRG
jgi:hypothetical protein